MSGLKPDTLEPKSIGKDVTLPKTILSISRAPSWKTWNYSIVNSSVQKKVRCYLGTPSNHFEKVQLSFFFTVLSSFFDKNCTIKNKRQLY